MECCEADVVIIGAGAAGLCVALNAAPRRVLLLAPADPEMSCTELAKGGIAAPLSTGDSVDLHVADTMRAADHSGSEPITGIIIGNAIAAIQFLERAGVRFDTSGGRHDLHMEAGHGLPRILHAGGDRTGAAIHRALLARARASKHICFMNGACAVSLLTGHAGIGGVVSLRADGTPLAIRASDTVLATGGLGQLFAATTNARNAAGDGLAMALVRGASVAGLEFVQFHPTALRSGLDPLPLLTEALRGAGATLIAGGGRFMPGIDARAELAPRDIVARAVWAQQQRGDEVFLDARAVFVSSRGGEFPAALAACAAHGIDPAHRPIPVTCAAHFHMGGIVVDEQGRTSVPGLWAAGEVAYTGLHGANRLASNSLLEAVVIGRAAGRAIAGTRYRRRPSTGPDVGQPVGFDGGRPQWRQLRTLMWRAMGPVRDAEELKRALVEVNRLSGACAPDEVTFRQRLTLAAAMIEAALLREESRGAHWRSDFAQRNRTIDGAGALRESGRRLAGSPAA